MSSDEEEALLLLALAEEEHRAKQKMEVEVLETVLKSWWKQERVQKVLSIEPEAATGEGQNFLSTTKRLKMKVVLGNGRVANRTAILKLSELNCGVEDLLKDLGVFQTETMMYLTVLQEMENVMDKFNCTEDALWCKLLHYEPYSSILLEDLKMRGYKSLMIPCYLDIDHALLVLRSLGLFHGMSKVLEERGIISEKDFSPWYVFRGRPDRIWWAYLQELVTVMIDNWDPSWKPIAEKLKNVSVNDIHKRMKEVEKHSESSFRVLNHGDPIVPNLMFKYDWTGQPISMRFVDFQLPTFCSPCIDITYFLYRATQASLRKENFQTLLECYHSSLLNTLDTFGYKGRRPSFEELMAEMERVSFLGAVLFLVNYAPEPITETEFGNDWHKKRIFGIYKRQDSENELGPGVRELIEKHLS